MKALGVVIGDGHGSPEFIRQAAEWERYTRARGDVVEVHAFKVSSLPIARRWDLVRGLLERATGVEQLAVFCHGWSSGIQLCPGVRVRQFARVLSAASSSPGPVVTLYCCTTGSDTDPRTPETSGSDAPGGDGGFADELRDALCEAGRPFCRVDAHTVLGHTTRNPYVRRFEGLGLMDGGAGGGWLVRPGSKPWGAWVHAVAGALRWDFPLLELAEIRARLAVAA